MKKISALFIGFSALVILSSCEIGDKFPIDTPDAAKTEIPSDSVVPTSVIAVPTPDSVVATSDTVMPTPVVTPPADVVVTPVPTPPAPEPVKNPAPVAEAKAISVIAKQFAFEPSTITVNEGDEVTLTITSVDVAHGFSLKDFNVSVKLAPGETSSVTFKADKKGTFDFRCNVQCGAGHGEMTGKLIVQ